MAQTLRNRKSCCVLQAVGEDSSFGDFMSCRELGEEKWLGEWVDGEENWNLEAVVTGKADL